MGSKISKAVRRPHVHKAVASSPATSHHEQPQTGSRQDQRLPDIKSGSLENDTPTHVATSSTPHDNSSTPANEVDAMEIDQLPRLSTNSRAESLRRSLQDLATEVTNNVTPPPPPPPPVVAEPPIPPPPEPIYNCLICCTTFAKEKLHTAVKPCNCGSLYCTNCIRNMFLDACKDLTRMPPRCCNQIPLHHARQFLTHEEAAVFRSKYDEWGTPNPLYCPVARCSTFIPSRFLPSNNTNSKGKQRVDSGVGTPTSPVAACPTCKTEVCTNCRSFAHAGATCDPLEFGVDKETAELLKSWGYKRCPKCGNGVKRMYGCNHMECRCGAHFCWVCLESRDDCDGGCYDDDEDYDSDDDPDRDENEDEPEPQDENTNIAEIVTVEGDAATQEPVAQSVEIAPPAERADSTDAPEATIAERLTTPIQPRPRVRNLDGGSGRYWEEQDLDFGREPTDDIQDRQWYCDHDFSTAKIPLADSLKNAPSAHGMECMKCWSTIHPEIEMPSSLKASGLRTAPSAATNRPLRARGRGRGIARFGYNISRNPFSQSMDVFATSVPEVVFMSQGNPFSEPMEDVQFTQDTGNERVVDTYGNTIATTEKPEDIRRASLDIPVSGTEHEHVAPEWLQDSKYTHTHTNDKAPLASATHLSPFSFAYDCHHCGLLVCNTCKDNLRSAQENDE